MVLDARRRDRGWRWGGTTEALSTQRRGEETAAATAGHCETRSSHMNEWAQMWVVFCVESVPPAPAHQSPPRELTSVRLSSVPRRHHSYSAGIPPFLAADFEKEARKGIGCVMASRRRRETKLGHLPGRGRAGERLPSRAQQMLFLFATPPPLPCDARTENDSLEPRGLAQANLDQGMVELFCSGISDKKVTVGRAKT